MGFTPSRKNIVRHPPIRRTGRGDAIMCMHARCVRPARYIVSHEEPNHREFKGQTHDCCAVHAPRPKKETT